MGDPKVHAAPRILPKRDSTDEYPMLAWDPSLNSGRVAVHGAPDLQVFTLSATQSEGGVTAKYSGGKGSAMKHFAADEATAFVLVVRPSLRDDAGAKLPLGRLTRSLDLRGQLFDAFVARFYGDGAAEAARHPCVVELRRRFLAQDPARVEQVVLVFPNELRAQRPS